MIITAQTTIKAPVERVFAVFTDFQNMESRLSAVKSIEFLMGNGKAEPGMKWRETRVMFGKEATEEMWISEINHNQSYVVEAQSHGTKYRSTYTFADNGDATDVALDFTIEPVTWLASLGSIMSIAFKGSIKKAFVTDMEDLKRFIEGDTKSAAADSQEVS